MTPQEKRTFDELLYRFSAQSLAFIALLNVLSVETPDLEQQIVARLDKLRYPDIRGHAIIDEAIDFVKHSFSEARK